MHPGAEGADESAALPAPIEANAALLIPWTKPPAKRFKEILTLRWPIDCCWRRTRRAACVLDWLARSGRFRARAKFSNACAMRQEDVVLPSYRDNGTLLWRGTKMEEILL